MFPIHYHLDRLQLELAVRGRPDGGRGKGNFSWVFRLERSILMTGWVQCGSEVRYVLKSRFNTPLTV